MPLLSVFLTTGATWNRRGLCDKLYRILVPSDVLAAKYNFGGLIFDRIFVDGIGLNLISEIHFSEYSWNLSGAPN